MINEFSSLSCGRTSAQLKQIARGLMIGKYRNAISILLASNLIINTLSLFTTSVSYSYAEIMIGVIISFILVLLSSILNVGQCSFYLNIACQQPFQFSDLFNGFRVHPDKIIITQIAVQLLTALPFIPAFVVMIIAGCTENFLLVLPTCLLLIAGCAVSWWLSLKYSQIYYLLLDFPDCSAGNLLKMSSKLMKGNIGKLLYMQVSFIPLTFAGLLSFGIGLLFVQPYQNMTYALFYLDLIHNRNL